MSDVRRAMGLRGVVQGVGFRPHVYRLATSLGLRGFVLNDGGGVRIEVEGPPSSVEAFCARVVQELPPHAAVHEAVETPLEPAGYDTFLIRESPSASSLQGSIVADLAICDDCRKELFDPDDRRFHYPFINCTHCGPRYSIVFGSPYDRERTSMKMFTMCPECRREYDDPADRRFHAQPNACPRCGPHVSLWDSKGKAFAERYDAIVSAAGAIEAGLIVAVKGLGGFHLFADALNSTAVGELRRRKGREEKPFAVMMPDVASALKYASVSRVEESLMWSPESPIVLVEAFERNRLSANVAPRLGTLGLMLPYTPLHALLMDVLDRPVVATSGNRSDEPICIDEREALERLGDIADLFLVHNRPIVRPVDDSIVRMMAGEVTVIRRSRGYSPAPFYLPHPVDAPLLCLGAHQKSTIAWVFGDQAVVSQHIGDLDTLEAREAFLRESDDIQCLFPAEKQPSVVCDLHPDYASSIEASRRSAAPLRVQHHMAHAASCRLDNRLTGPALSVAWDGTGYGTDGTIWGGEFFEGDGADLKRVASMLPFPLIGGDATAREPKRSAIGILFASVGDQIFERADLPPVASLAPADRAVLRSVFASGRSLVMSSSVGRLFDAVASIVGLRQRASYEGQAAAELEALAASSDTTQCYHFDTARDAEILRLDWRPMVRRIERDVRGGISRTVIARKFHNTLTAMIVDIARRCEQYDVLLTGGCFQNKLLLEDTVRQLTSDGKRAYWHRRIPPNDGGISLGQAVIAAASQRGDRTGERATHTGEVNVCV